MKKLTLFLFLNFFLPSSLFSAQTPGKYGCVGKRITYLTGPLAGSIYVLFCSRSVDPEIYLFRNGTYKKKRAYYPYETTVTGAYTVAGNNITFSEQTLTGTLSDAGDVRYITFEYISDVTGFLHTITYRWNEDVEEESPGGTSGSGSSGGLSDFDIPSSGTDAADGGMTETEVFIQAGNDGRINPENSSEEGTVVFTPLTTGTVDAKIFAKEGIYVDGITFDVKAGESTGIIWDGRDADRNPVASGSYFLVIQGAGLNIKVPLAVVK